jgi:hypothetical protein
LTEIVHVAFAATDPPLNEILVAPATAVTVPPQVVAAPGVGDTTTFVGRVSVKLIPLSAAALACVLPTVIVSTESEFRPTEVGKNALLSVGFVGAV